MSGSTISSKIAYGITLGSGGFNSPLTITLAGGIKAQAGAAGVYSSLASGAIYNSGAITGGAAANIFAAGAAGVSITGGVSLTNAGSITGGASGGDGVVTTSYIENLSTGIITGGGGGDLSSVDGGYGVALQHGRLTNFGTIRGGANEASSGYGAPGTGVFGTGYLNNGGTIIGGSFVYNVFYPAGAAAVAMTGTVVNSGAIDGGSANGGLAGGLGVDLGAGVLDNSGTITGGAGPVGAAGVYVGGHGTLVNAGIIDGAPGAMGVFMTSGGLVINSGTIEGSQPNDPFSLPVALDFDNGDGTLVVDAGARFIGAVQADARYANTLSVAGYTTVTGVGSHYTGFQNIAFGGYGATVVGGVPGLASGESITGFAARDVIALGGFIATGAAFTSSGVELFAGGNSLAVNLKGPGAANIEVSGITLVSGAVVGTSIEALDFGGGLFAGQIELVGAGGSAYAPYINTGGQATIYAGGTVSAAHIAGGLLDVAAGAKIVGPVYFYGTGTLEIGGTVAPTNQIFGFVAGETIELSSLPFTPGGTARVVAPDHVVIRDDGQILKLHIYDTTVGENLILGAGPAGSVLTVGTADKMGFLPPETAAARENWFGGSVMVETPAPPPMVVPGTVHFGGGPDLLETVHKGGAQGFVVLPHG